MTPTDFGSIKIYGERHTGTNYLAALVARNIDAQLLPGVAPRLLRAATRVLRLGEWPLDSYSAATRGRNLGWKHRDLSDVGTELPARPDVLAVILVKNPYSWLVSLHRRPYHTSESSMKVGEVAMARFASTPWKTVSRESGPDEYASPVDMWNVKTAASLAAANLGNAVLVKFEDLISEPEAVVDRLAAATGNTREAAFVNLTTSTKDKDVSSEEIQNYYAQELWRADLDEQSLVVINERLSKKVLTSAGYELIRGTL